ncbi:hypothetical protein TSMEX_002858 [Taenia solium]|eukprot:TsM_000279800 transcript=TsM_000279800 gene=TsM_000279800
MRGSERKGKTSRSMRQATAQYYCSVRLHSPTVCDALSLLPFRLCLCLLFYFLSSHS